MKCIQASNWAMLVSLSQGLTSSRMEDLATNAGFLAFFFTYHHSHFSHSRTASLSSSSLSLPNRSMSLSLSPSASVAAFLAGGSTWRMGDTCWICRAVSLWPDKLFSSMFSH
uniref:Uncharacterized protein n=1 Tax=Piliocolobus tephrosceles TaxID=591936 RepID=A0A8C9GQK4_9PRIM